MGHRINRVALLSLAIVALAGCAHAEYTQYEGGGIQQGSGGAKTTVDGIDIWKDGTPPHRYKILGIVDDNRGAGWIGQSGFDRVP